MAGRRWLTLTALFGTLAALMIVTTLAEIEGLAHAGIQLSVVQITYGLLIGLLVVALRFQARIQFPRWPIGLFPLISFYAVWQLNPVQEARLFEMPFSLWVIVVHAVGISLLAGLLVADSTSPKWLSRAVNIMITGLGLILVVLYIASADEFMALDVPDEPWLASVATNYALHNDFSPSFIAAPYGSPDPVLPRYYLLMGLWLKLTGTSLAALRAFPLLIGLAGAGLFGWLLWRTRLQGLDRSRLSKLEDDGFELAGLHLPLRMKITSRMGVMIGVSVLLGMSAYLRMSHNLRMDIGLGIYGVVMLFGLLHIFEDKAGRWALWMGLALLVGLETVPSMGGLLGATAGLVLLIWARHQLHERIRIVVVYGLSSILALAVYLSLHFLPDVQTSLAGFRQFTTVYSTTGQPQDLIDVVLHYHLRFSLSLAPIELLVLIAAVVWLWSTGGRHERWMLAVFGLTLVLALLFLDLSYGYWVLFAPLGAYAITRFFQRLPQVSILVLLPALLAAPIHDLGTAMSTRPNQQLLAEHQAVLAQIPPGGIVVGDPVFWYTMHTDWAYVGWTGVEIYGRVHQLVAVDTLEKLNPSAVICSQNRQCRQAEDTGLFGVPIEVRINDTPYLIYLRQQ